MAIMTIDLNTWFLNNTLYHPLNTIDNIVLVKYDPIETKYENISPCRKMYSESDNLLPLTTVNHNYNTNYSATYNGKTLYAPFGKYVVNSKYNDISLPPNFVSHVSSHDNELLNLTGNFDKLFRYYLGTLKKPLYIDMAFIINTNYTDFDTSTNTGLYIHLFVFLNNAVGDIFIYRTNTSTAYPYQIVIGKNFTSTSYTVLGSTNNAFTSTSDSKIKILTLSFKIDPITNKLICCNVNDNNYNTNLTYSSNNFNFNNSITWSNRVIFGCHKSIGLSLFRMSFKNQLFTNIINEYNKTTNDFPTTYTVKDILLGEDYIIREHSIRAFIFG